MSEPALPARASVEAAPAAAEARLHQLDAERVDAAARAAALRTELAALDPGPATRAEPFLTYGSAGAPQSADKVKLFRALFRGRDDVYPTRFVSRKTGKPGYAYR
jgi:hypothetical protein